MNISVILYITITNVTICDKNMPPVTGLSHMSQKRYRQIWNNNNMLYNIIILEYFISFYIIYNCITYVTNCMISC